MKIKTILLFILTSTFLNGQVETYELTPPYPPYDHVDLSDLLEYPGLKIKGDDKYLNYLLAFHIKKCSTELSTFKDLLTTVKQDFENNKIDTIKFFPKYLISSQPFAEGITKGSIGLNMMDFRLLPDPLINNQNANSEYYYPKWATTGCAFLGHEIAELRANLLKGNWDRPEHHCKIANKVEDNIMNETFNTNRKRGKDLAIKHGNHIDIIIEIENKGYIIMHQAPETTHFSRETGKPIKLRSTYNITHIDYFEGNDYQLRASDIIHCECQN